MNIMINFDVINAIKDVNEGFNPFKLVRNNRNMLVKFSLPVLFIDELIISKATGDDFSFLFSRGVTMLVFWTIVIDLIAYKRFGDIYKEKGEKNLTNLVQKLKDIEVDTTYEMLKEAYIYHRKYNIKLNEKKIPQLIESKYILVHSYDYKGDVSDTSLLQEHVVGSKKYILSIGSHQKVLKPVYNRT